MESASADVGRDRRTYSSRAVSLVGVVIDRPLLYRVSHLFLVVVPRTAQLERPGGPIVHSK
jgi:hypothetical protein